MIANFASLNAESKKTPIQPRLTGVDVAVRLLASQTMPSRTPTNSSNADLDAEVAGHRQFTHAALNLILETVASSTQFQWGSSTPTFTAPRPVELKNHTRPKRHPRYAVADPLPAKLNIRSRGRPRDRDRTRPDSDLISRSNDGESVRARDHHSGGCAAGPWRWGVMQRSPVMVRMKARGPRISARRGHARSTGDGSHDARAAMASTLDLAWPSWVGFGAGVWPLHAPTSGPLPTWASLALRSHVRTFATGTCRAGVGRCQES
uniref:Predicted protein n=1 Tax=Physcomitrium patens TaxID=3218 RepID=A9U7F4_PHYPA